MSSYDHRIEDVDLAHDVANVFSRAIDDNESLSDVPTKPNILIEQGSQAAILSKYEQRLRNPLLKVLDKIFPKVARGRNKDLMEMAVVSANYESLAKRDLLTHVYDRRGLNAKLMENIIEIKHSDNPQGLTVLLLDAMNFKSYNDQFGYGEGDVLIRAIADTLTGEIRKSDTLARFGGDEFVVILPSTSFDQAKEAIYIERHDDDDDDIPTLGIIDAANKRLREVVERKYHSPDEVIPDILPGQLRSSIFYISPEQITSTRSNEALVDAINDKITEGYEVIKTVG